MTYGCNPRGRCKEPYCEDCPELIEWVAYRVGAEQFDLQPCRRWEVAPDYPIARFWPFP